MKPKYLWMRPVLGICVTIGFLVLTGFMSYKIFTIGIDKVDRELLILFAAAVQALILMVKDGHSFYFGTTQGSANKSETIDNFLSPPPAPAPQE